MPTILVADDNSNIQKMVTLALKDVGITVVAVSNGEAAVRKLPDLRPDLVLADIFMPVRNGYEVCEYMKTDERFAHIPVILLVGAFDPLDEHEVERVHADGVLKKPFVPPTPLITMVTALLEKFATAAAAQPPAASRGFGSAAPGLEKTQRLSPEEVAAATKQSAAAFSMPEPEPEQYAAPPNVLNIDAAHSPLAFQEMLGDEEEPADEADETAEETEEIEAAAKVNSFEASSVSAYHFPGELEPGAAAEVPAAHEESHAPSHHQNHEQGHEQAEDHWGGIKEEMKQPDPAEPPIPVHFGESAPAEIISEERGPEIAVKPDPALVSSANDWMSSRPAVQASLPELAPEVAPEPVAEPSAEALRMESESPAPPPEVEPAKSVEEPHQYFTSAPFTVRASETSAEVAAAEEETQEVVTAESARTAGRIESAEPDAHTAPQPPSRWGRLEGLMTPTAPSIAAAAGATHAHTQSESFANAEHRVEQLDQHTEEHGGKAFERAATPSGFPVSSGLSAGESQQPSERLVQSITENVLKQLDPSAIEKISRELIRPLIEALIRREVDKG
ncbi:MAG: response regulator [Acidipila sp.]|nr:response regulator [Acidipila sp.]